MSIVFNSGVFFQQPVSGSGISNRASVRVATTTAGSLATDFESGDTIDGITLSTGDRILIKNQASAVENGIYDVQASGSPIRTIDCSDGNDITSINIFVKLGTVNANTAWTCTSTVAIVGTNNLTFTQYDVVSTLTATRGGTGVTSFGGTNTILYTTAVNTLSSLATSNNSILRTNGSGVPSLSATLPSNLTIGSPFLIPDNDSSQFYQITGGTLTAGAAANSIITLPSDGGTAYSDIFTLNARTQTLTNKTLTAPVISTIVNTGTLTLPTTTTTLVGRTTTDTLTNKTLTSPVISTIVNTGTLTLPTTTTTLVGRTTTDTLTNKTLTSPVISTIVNTGTLTLPTSTDTLVARNTADTLTNKTLTSPVISTIVNVGTLTLPTTTDTLVGRATIDTLTNKTLTAPVISTIVNSGTLTLPTTTDTLVGRATTDTLTNKTLTTPRIVTSILDTNGNTLLGITAVASAVNQFTISDAATGNDPILSATGTDTNIGLTYLSKGTGVHNFNNTTTSAEIRLFDTANTGYIGLKSANSNTNYTLTLPSTQGSSGQVLVNNGSGTLSWGVSNITNSNTTSTTVTSTTSTTFILLASMTVTPASGTYLVLFSSNGSLSQQNTTGTYSIFNNGTQVTTSTQLLSIGGNQTTNINVKLYTQSIETVNGSQTIDIRYNVSAGTFTVNNRSLILIKLA